MKIALVNMRPKIADKKTNLRKMDGFLSKISADLVIFGEITLTGYRCKDELRNLAETIDGSSVKYMKNLAKKHDCHIVFGMPLLDSKIKGLINNAAILIHPDGKADVYKKWFLPNIGPFEEKLYFDEGEELPVFDTKLGKIGMSICYDIYYPEIFRSYSLQGADMIICISASPSITREYFEKLIPARALENTIFMIYVNIVGNQEDLVFWGGSQVYDPLGNLIIKAPYFKEGITTCDIDLKKLHLARGSRPLLRDIRPEIYHDLYELSRRKNK
jgi:predicted amidohydrolase